MTANPAGTWPNYFPADCPPDTAQPAQGVLFRFAKKATPTEKDLTCHWVLFEHHRADFVATGRHCQCCGLSVYLTVETARIKRGLIPALRKAHLFTITLPTPDGKLLHTPSTNDPEHHTWWTQTPAEVQVNLMDYIEGP